jgi:DNA polymerase III epsilon subunit-like protein
MSEYISIFDLETTGCDSKNDWIVQICIWKVHKFSLQRMTDYTTFVNPPKPISVKASEHTGITHDDYKGAEAFQKIAPYVAHLMDNTYWAGHNIKDFDIPILLREFKAAGVTPPRCAGIIDTVIMCRQYNLPSRTKTDNKLQSVARYFKVLGRHEKQPHEADGDVKITYEVLKSLSCALFLDLHFKPLALDPAPRHDAAAVAQALRPPSIMVPPINEAEEKKKAAGIRSPELHGAVQERVVFNEDLTKCGAKTTSGNQCQKPPFKGTRLCQLHMAEVAKTAL